ncbi:MarR family winged helix-turn-helix transcriptional regulator [Neobacillus sp. LXY-4]|uniref:MarR family winged helix-turn-helix transcriptional regulator n=1 Tax=Neobacillus sp. LXY-4 TaxID=3379826 RepID=UPI003EE14504
MQKQPIGKLISVINRQSQKYLTRELKKYNIGSGGQHSFLIEIIMQPGKNQDQLTSELRFDKATTARTVKQLELAGFIERQIDENDRRSYRLYPTQKGIDFLPTLRKILKAANTRLTNKLTMDEEDQLICLLKKLVED